MWKCDVSVLSGQWNTLKEIQVIMREEGKNNSDWCKANVTEMVSKVFESCLIWRCCFKK